MNKNPYNINFGKAPEEIIPRTDQIQEVEEAFLYHSQQSYIVTGVRGSGKTVFMTYIVSKCEEKNWIVLHVNLSNPDSAMKQILIQLANQKKLKKHLDFKSLSLDILGFGIQVERKEILRNDEYDVGELLKLVKKYDQKVLIAIDEVNNTASMRELAGAFQIWIRQDIPVYLLMTGLYENIKELQDDKALTFLYRCPRIDLAPLSKEAIKENYLSNLNISEQVAVQMTKATKGYSFAFQALGHSVWMNKGYNREAKNKFKKDLFDYSYSKIWSELSNNDRKVCIALAQSKTGSSAQIKEILGWTNNQLNPYRRRLLNKQIIESKRKGEMEFVLPLFEEFILNLVEFGDEF